MADLKHKSSKKKKNIKQEIVFADIAMIVLGLIMAIFPEQSNDLLIIIIGAVLCVWGVLRLITYFSHSTTAVFGSFALVQGALLIGFGFFFIIRPSALQAILAVTLGVIIIIGGVMKLQYAVDMIRLGARFWWISLITAAITVSLGIISLANPFNVAKWLMFFIGISFILNGALDLVSVILISRNVKARDKMIDVTSSDDDDDFYDKYDE